MFSTFWMRLYGPIPKLSLFWTGTLIRLETGFWVAFASAAVPLSSTAGFVAAGCVVACWASSCCVPSCCALQLAALQANPHNRIVSSNVFHGALIFVIRFAPSGKGRGAVKLPAREPSPEVDTRQNPAAP